MELISDIFCTVKVSGIRQWSLYALSNAIEGSGKFPFVGPIMQTAFVQAYCFYAMFLAHQVFCCMTDDMTYVCRCREYISHQSQQSFDLGQ